MEAVKRGAAKPSLDFITSLPGYYLLVRAESTLVSFVKSRQNI